MQTFLPYSDFTKSASVLDMKRLGKQRVEAFQIMKALTTPDYPWRNHPAVKMWRGYEYALDEYYTAVVNEWIRRGYKNNMPLSLLPVTSSEFEKPWWLGARSFHNAHKAALSSKFPEWYVQYWRTKPFTGYVWPSRAK